MEPRILQRKELMSVPEAGERLGLPRSTAYDAARRGMFPVVRNGKRMYVPVAAFENWLATATTYPTWPQKEEAPGA